MATAAAAKRSSRKLVFDHPDLIPMLDIEPAFTPLISGCTELVTSAGPVDNIWVTPAGGLVLGECKLVRNPQARREVVAQALDFARAMSGWRYEDLEREVRRSLKQPAARGRKGESPLGLLEGPLIHARSNRTPLTADARMTDTTNETQARALASAMAHLLAIIDQGLVLDEVRLPERPFRATMDLLRHGLVELHVGEKIDVDRPWDHLAEPWFRVIFRGVEEWYRDQYGAEALVAKGNPPLKGVVLIRGSPFLIHVPMHRGKVEVEGKTAWMYFEAGLGEDEDPRSWVIDRPNFARLDDNQAREADANLHHVATSLRAVQHHLLGSGTDETQAGLRASIRSYLEIAARRIRAQSAAEFTLAWMDLQTAAEAALKLIIFRATGTHPHKHELVADLLSHTGAASVPFNRARLSGWPAFKTISNRRYGKDYMAGLAELYAAYTLILDLVAACVRTIDPPLASGAGFLVHVAPYLIDDPILHLREPTDAPA